MSEFEGKDMQVYIWYESQSATCLEPGIPRDNKAEIHVIHEIIAKGTVELKKVSIEDDHAGMLIRWFQAPNLVIV